MERQLSLKRARVAETTRLSCKAMWASLPAPSTFTQWGQRDVVAWLRQRHSGWVHLIELLESHAELYVDGFVLTHTPDHIELHNALRMQRCLVAPVLSLGAQAVSQHQKARWQ
eukprot:m51a1_g6586 hypothetical protein (113) ;mRNA; r:234568-235031